MIALMVSSLPKLRMAFVIIKSRIKKSANGSDSASVDGAGL
jgi:hypothetical protein